MEEIDRESIDYCLNCSRPANACDRCGGLIRPERRRLSEEKEKMVMELLEAGKSDAEIVRLTGVSGRTVWLRRRDWENKMEGN